MNDLMKYKLSLINYKFKLIFKLKSLNFFKGREDPIEFNILIIIKFKFNFKIIELFCWGDGKI